MARTVLVVEDEPTVRETLAESLVEDGLRVEHSRGRAAGARAVQGRSA